MPADVAEVPVTEDVVLFGSGLLTAAGRGVVAGRPYEEQLLTERQEMATWYRFRPGAARSLGAQTRKALGR